VYGWHESSQQGNSKVGVKGCSLQKVQRTQGFVNFRDRIWAFISKPKGSEDVLRGWLQHYRGGREKSKTNAPRAKPTTFAV